MTPQENLALTRSGGQGWPALGETLCLSFDAHCVVVDSNVGEVSEAFAAVVSPMITLDAKGETAGSFKVMRASKKLVIQGSDGPDESFSDASHAARVLYHRAVKVLIDARPDLLWLHAAAACFGGRAILLSAPSGQGKSTLLAELLEWGCSYLSDDVAPIATATASVLPFPLSPYKRVGGQGALSANEIEKLVKVAIEVSPHMVARSPSELRYIYFLRYDVNCTKTAFTPCSPGTAIIELLRNSFASREVREVEIQRLCNLVEHVPCSYLVYGDAQEAARHIVFISADRG